MDSLSKLMKQEKESDIESMAMCAQGPRGRSESLIVPRAVIRT
jgi:hypothetical protein